MHICKADKISLSIAGIISFLGGSVHFSFFQLFNATEVKNCLGSNWALIHPLILGSILLSYMVSYISIIYSEELINTRLGRPLLICFSLVYAIRLFSEFAFFGFSGLTSIMWIVICLIPIAIYIRIFFKNLNTADYFF